MGDNKNTIIAVVLAVIILFGYDFFVLKPMRDRAAAEAEATQAAQELAQADAPTPDGITPDMPAAPVLRAVEEVLSEGQRIPVRTATIEGSLNLTGARLDDIRLLEYTTAVDSTTPVTLLSPQDAPFAYYAANGWTGIENAPSNMPGLNTSWTLVEGDVLTPTTPVVLEYTTGDLTFRRTVRVDEHYMFTYDDSVTNASAQPVTLARYGLVRRHGQPADLANFYVLHEGPLGVMGNTFFDRKYKKIDKDGGLQETGQGGWIGNTDKYWMAVTGPLGENPNLRGEIRTLEARGETIYESNYIRDGQIIAPGETLTSQAFIYAGVKSSGLLHDYEEELGIPRFDMAIDWGMFWFLTRPFFYLLHLFNGFLGNFALAILLLTVLIKLVLYPLNNRAFSSMAKMRAVQPKVQELRERFENDKERQSKEMMELYKREKINPVAGCLPILPQIPIFFALYKTVFISLDARHESFTWIQDLSAVDPTTIWNLFGLLPFDPSGLPILGTSLHIGAWPLIMGITMWAQQALNPPPPDPMQRRIFAFMPIIFTFVMAKFPAALIIYWAWNNTLTVLQQYIIMRTQGQTTEVDRQIAKLRDRFLPRKGEGEN
ncbi:membrane protein insertase YidC [Woodsholea maritima]|uniref:membrane protein insertase YidC n=1 Tax=Woodsholea maritima TaxID=240237 RepID=UPI00035F222E|nr:membrane protein insertase YidC [Woodsholea maritima]